MLAGSIFGQSYGLVIEWRDQALSLAPDGSAWSSHHLIDLQSVASLTIEATAEAPRLAHEMAVFARPKPLAVADMNRLVAYGDRTLVAATASSRAAGRGERPFGQ